MERLDNPNLQTASDLNRLRYLRRLQRRKNAGDSSHVDRELIRAMKEVDRRDGPGAGERLLLEIARPWMEEQIPMEGDTHER